MTTKFRTHLTTISAAVPLAVTLHAADKTALESAAATPQVNPLSTSASLAAKESFDDNVFLQKMGPNANRSSMITTVMPAVGLAYKPTDWFNASLNYAPEFNIFHSASSENFDLHRIGLTLGGQADKSSWEVTESLTCIDGSDIGPTYLGEGGAPATGGPAVRDRRSAIIERGQMRFTQGLSDQWFVRPVLSGYFHDFRTVHKTDTGYQNFVDRNDMNGGADVGYKVTPDLSLLAGYRYGIQNQAQLFSEINPAHYDNTYHRALLGAEGKIFDWLKVSISAGPEFRYYDGIVAKGFERNELYAYSDTTLTASLTKADTVSFSAKRFEQPGFSGRSAYIDSTYELSWRHKFTDKLTIGLGARGYNNDFLKPSATREDWILTGSLLANYAFTERCSAEFSYSYDDAESLVANTPSREYTRNLISLGIKYVFK